jgi:TolB-like protein
MHSRGVSEVRTLAILPLQPLSQSAGENYFGLGVADALITRVSGMPALTVRPTSAIRRYAEGKTDALTAGGELQVDAVLDGSWQRESERVRVSVNLLRVRDGASLWTETVDLPASDVFSIQDRLSQQLAARLRLEADATAAQHVSRSAAGTRNAQAYDSYLRGSFYLGARGYNAGNRQTIDAAIEQLERAVALDPNFAEARARLGFAYAHVAIFMEQSRQLIERAQRETDAAAALNPNLGQVFLNRGFILWSWYTGWNIVDSVRYYRRAEELDPALTDIELSANYAHLGFFEEWRRTGEQVVARDPANRQARTTFVNEYFLLNLPEEGLAAQRRLLNTGPDERYFLLMRRIADAAPLVERQAASNPGSAWDQAELALLRALQGREADARALASAAARLTERFRFYHHVTYELARVYAVLGDADQAAHWLRETIEWGFPCYPMFSNDGFLDPVRKAPAVQAVLSDLKVRWDGYREALRQ